MILAYIIAWIIIPMARTAPEKLAMKGAAINVENIGKTVTDGFEKVNDYVRSDRPRSILQKIGDCVCGGVPYQIPACFHCYLLCACIVCIIDCLFCIADGGYGTDCCIAGCAL